jgi:threonylcarbamoyladenosine tRNA methylthiotransferase MtaB
VLKKKVAFYTLGCKVNYCETESLQNLFEEAGYSIVDFDQPADVYVVNTCTVTATSDHKSRKALRRARRRSPDAIVVATGCYAQGESEQIRKMEVADLVIGNQGREDLPSRIESLKRGLFVDEVVEHENGAGFEMLPPAGRRGRTRGFLKIQEGCDQGCSYCVVPRVRGPLRSLPADEVLKRAEILLKSGCRELVLTGIHLGLYGNDLSDISLAKLLSQMEGLDDLLRLRLSSLEPSDITSELVEQITSSKVICPHLHIPLQSGDGEILRLMNRPYEPVEYLYLARWLKQQQPGLALSSDIIVGFPGETEKHHRRSMALIREVGFSHLHVFKYSARPGTRASDFPNQLANQVKEERSREMITLGEEMALAYRSRFLGSSQPIFVEKVVPYQYAEGFTPHYLRVKIATPNKSLHWRGREVYAFLEKDEGSHIMACKKRL